MLQDFTEFGWEQNEKYLKKEFIFPDFKSAIFFVMAVAHVAEALNHHPNWTNIYNKIVVELTTHDANGVTEKDYFLANEMDRLFEMYRKK
ncbi:MAG: 4a-hydroxytetrahydrobiopterin dehydratase [Pseudomonadota bacterium]